MIRQSSPTRSWRSSGIPAGGESWGAAGVGWARSGTPGRRWRERSRPCARRWGHVMRVSVFGLGYVGCVTATCLAKAGHEVIGVDANPEKVSMVNAAAAPVVEPGLGEALVEV